jgi:hypothetical protein
MAKMEMPGFSARISQRLPMRTIFAALCAVGLVLSATSAHADRRVAFVVGNGTYKNVDQLPNPPVDAKAMAALLRNNGFDVVEGINLNRDAMTAKLREFALKTPGADIAIFFYAGHGIAVDGKNYLIPIDADLKSEVDVKLGAAVDVDVTLDQTLSDAKVKLVLLDACRDNPFAAKIRSASRTRAVTVATGLAEMKSGEGTLIAFATGPGQTALDGDTGGNSPFTRALLAHITEPGVEIQQAMTRVRADVNARTAKQQLPWSHTNLTGAVYLNPVAAPPTDAPAAADAAPGPAPAAKTTSEVELEFWRSIKDTNKQEELNAYLASYPNGQFRSLALARVAALQSAPPPSTTARTTAPAAAAVDQAVFTADATQVTEDQLGLDRNRRRNLQNRLTGLGFDVHASGKFDDATRQVITRWQTARGYPNSGFLNKLQLDALMNEPVSKSEPVGEDQAEGRHHRGGGGGQRSARHSGGGGGGGGGGGRSSGPFFGPPTIMFSPFGRR